VAPTGKDIEALLINLHRQSAQSQRKARRSQAKVRAEVYKRLEGKVVEVDDTNTVVVAVVTTRELTELRRPPSRERQPASWDYWRSGPRSPLRRSKRGGCHASGSS
jgi:hypothetical protein